MPLVLALLSSLLWGVSDFLGGTLSRRVPAGTVLGLSQLAALVGLVPFALALGGSADVRGYLGPAVGAGLVGMVALGSFYRALATGTMGVVAPVASLGVVLPVLAGLLRGEQPSGWQLAGILTAVLGVVLASGPELSRGRSGATPLLLAAVAAVGFGLVLLLVADASRSSLVMTLLTMRLTSVLSLSVGFVVVGLRRRGPQRWDLGVRAGHLPVLVAVGAGDVGANAAFAAASGTGLVSVTAVLASLYPVVTVLLARRLHAEHLRRVQVVGVVAALGGVALLASS